MNKNKLSESRKVIQSLTRFPKRPIIVNFSGGKDSLCVLFLTLDVIDKAEALYMDSSYGLPGVKDYAVDICKELGVKLHITHPKKHWKGNFIELIRFHGYFPCISNTWCRKDFKIRPQRAYLRSIYGRLHIFKITGVRRFESTRRLRIYKGRRFIEPDEEHHGAFLVNAILNWTDKDVKTFLADRGFSKKVSPLYKKYGVSDCKWCPYYQESIYKRIAKMTPGIYDDIIELEKEINTPSVTGHKWLGKIVYGD